jgi:hypothetical protein
MASNSREPEQDLDWRKVKAMADKKTSTERETGNKPGEVPEPQPRPAPVPGGPPVSPSGDIDNPGKGDPPPNPPPDGGD